jgi:Tol biopolymer transport system component
MWLERGGPLRPLRSAPSSWATPRFSPDGRRLALTIADGPQEDIWTYDWERDILTRITSDPAIDNMPIWTPDGTRIIFGSARNGATNLYWQRADGTGPAHRLTESVEAQLPDSVHPNGRVLAFHQGNPAAGQQSLMLLPLEDDGAGGWKPAVPTTLLGGPFLKAFPTFSPDGHWLTYATTESGRFEIYVQPFPGPGARVQVSNGGATRAMWSPTGREIYYAAGIGAAQTRMMVVPSAKLAATASTRYSSIIDGARSGGTSTPRNFEERTRNCAIGSPASPRCSAAACGRRPPRVQAR